MGELEIRLALNRTGMVGSTILGRLRRAFGSLERAASATARELAGVEGVGDATARAIRKALDDKAGASEVAAAHRSGARIVTPDDDDYPALLRFTIDYPAVLYVRGDLRREDGLAIGMVGTRHPTDYGCRMAHRLAQGLSELEITVVSGLARGIDSVSHAAALEKGRTIAVLGSGLNQIYPPENRSLAEQIARAGALVSEFPMDEPPRPAHFPRRNRIISGLSLGVVCVEASPTSGALVSCAWSLEQGREVFAVPGQADHPTARGSNGLIRQGAKLVEEVSDIVEEIGAFAPIVGRLRRLEPEDPLQRIVWRAVRDGADTIERLGRATGLGPDVLRRLIEELVCSRRLRKLGHSLRLFREGEEIRG